MQMLRKHHIEIFLLLLFTVAVWPYFHLDFWNDEIYTFVNFVTHGVKEIIAGDYDPNNHILVNLLNLSIKNLMGHESINEIIENPIPYRITSYVVSIFTIISFFRFSKLVFKDKRYHIANALFSLNIVFINFSMQLRGYATTLLFVILLTHQIIGTLEDRKKSRLFWVTIFSMILVYNLPSNLYFIIAIIFWLALVLIFHHWKFNFNKIWYSIEIKIIISIIIGSILAILLFIPIFEAVFFNNWVKPQNESNFQYLANIFIEIFANLIYYSIPFLILFLIGSALIIINFNRNFKLISLFSIIVLLPFLVSILRNDLPPSRAFIFILPFFIIWITVGIKLFADKVLPRFHGNNHLIIISLSIVIFILGSIKNERILMEDLVKVPSKHKRQDLFSQYFLRNYQPSVDFENFKSKYDGNSPVIIRVWDCWVAPYYLQNIGIKGIITDNIDSVLETNDHAYLVTNRPRLEKFETGKRVEIVQDRKTYHSFIKITKE